MKSTYWNVHKNHCHRVFYNSKIVRRRKLRHNIMRLQWTIIIHQYIVYWPNNQKYEHTQITKLLFTIKLMLKNILLFRKINATNRYKCSPKGINALKKINTEYKYDFKPKQFTAFWYKIINNNKNMHLSQQQKIIIVYLNNLLCTKRMIVHKKNNKICVSYTLLLQL